MPAPGRRGSVDRRRSHRTARGPRGKRPGVRGDNSMIRRLRPVDRRQFPRPATRGAWAGVEALEGRQLLSTSNPLQAVPLQGLPGGGGGGQADTTPPTATLSTTVKDPSGLFFDVD